MARSPLSLFQRPAILHVLRDATGSEAVAARLRVQPHFFRTTLHHPQSIVAVQPPIGDLAFAIKRSEEGSSTLPADPCCRHAARH